MVNDCKRKIEACHLQILSFRNSVQFQLARDINYTVLMAHIFKFENSQQMNNIMYRIYSPICNWSKRTHDRFRLDWGTEKAKKLLGIVSSNDMRMILRKISFSPLNYYINDLNTYPHLCQLFCLGFVNSCKLKESEMQLNHWWASSLPLLSFWSMTLASSPFCFFWPMHFSSLSWNQ